MFGLTTLGIVHTAISLVAVTAGIIALVRDKEISWKNTVGKIYVVTTILTCLTGFGIFQHGGFGKPHVLGIITLLVLGLAFIAGSSNKPFGKASTYIQTVSFSMTFFFHLVPAFTESFTRLPLDAPFASGPEDPKVQAAVGICFLLFLIGATLQVLKLQSKVSQ